MSAMTNRFGAWALALMGAAFAAVGATGCQTDAFCWDHCAGDKPSSSGTNSTSSGTGGAGGAGGDCFPFCNVGGGSNVGGSGGSGPCTPTNGGIEACDGLDNDCNGQIDDSSDINFGSPKTCGTCTNDCYQKLLNADPNKIGCTPSANPGKDPGTCTCGGCAADYYDLNNDCVCEYYCVKVPGAVDDSSCNNKDDDCDGVKDEDVDLCKSTTDCGKCGNNCVVLHGTPQCTQSGAGACTPANTKCEIAKCDDGWWDLDNSYATGCEYSCTKTNGGVEICGDSVDNDCDGKIDEADDLSQDPQIGQPCFGDKDGVCGLQAHAGTTQCVGNKVVCTGPNVLVENQLPETCNGQDDDCDGVVDDNPMGVGDSCGTSNVFPCSFGKKQCQNGAVVCIGAIDPKPETCNGQDDNCDGTIDNSPVDVGMPCGQSSVGACKKGTSQCLAGGVVSCLGNIDPKSETCNGADDDCNGAIDDVPGAGTSCGQSSTAPCKLGTLQCVGTNLTCVGNIDPKTETCNNVDDNCNGQVDENIPAQPCLPAGANPNLIYGGLSQCRKGTQACGGACTGYVGPSVEVCDSIDNDCDGVVDNNLTDLGACSVPPPPPNGATSPCKAGTKTCVAGILNCQGSVGPSSTIDSCGVDANCDGTLTNQPNLQTDVSNCGMCGKDCYAGSVHSIWTCNGGACAFQGCQNGYYDLDGDKKCEYACTYLQAQESCNGLDDNCNGQIDENVVAPTPAQVCGVSPSASSPECTSQVTVACTNGAFKCTFPAGVCTGATCAATTEICDTLDNNCNGVLNENVSNYGKACASDDGKPAPGDGACRTTGTFVCNGTNATKCSAVKADCNSLAGGCTELCDGIDNDCDGAIDETYAAKGTNTANFVKPVVTKISSTRWVYSYEASRPSASTTNLGSGNGYWTSAPAGTTIDKTPACSVPSKLPWINVSPLEVEQTCTSMGGFICAVADWKTACQATLPCTWGYNPRTAAACNATYVAATKLCNLGPSYDFSTSLAGDQDGLLPTGSSALLPNCWADWSNLQSNTTATNKIYDITGNLREITKNAAVNPAVYPIMGGAFNTVDPNGATCTFDFYSTKSTDFKLYDTGFRCCFSQDPTL